MKILALGIAGEVFAGPKDGEESPVRC